MMLPDDLEECSTVSTSNLASFDEFFDLLVARIEEELETVKDDCPEVVEEF